MNISNVSNAQKICEISLGQNHGKSHGIFAFPNSLIVTWEDHLWDHDIPKRKNVKHPPKVRVKFTFVYLWVVNGEIMKIGKSSSSIDGCVSFYTNAGMNDDPGPSRFYCSNEIRAALDSGKKVEFYIIGTDSVYADVPSLTKTYRKKVNIDGKAIEQACLEEYESSEGFYPKWNLQEAANGYPISIQNMFNDYKISRTSFKKSNQ